MSSETLKLIPGVDQNKTPVLNEAAVSTSQLIRYAYDRSGQGLVQKLGGWSRFFPTAMPSPPRALLAWEDANGYQHLGVGCQSNSSGQAMLGVITNGSLVNVTPASTQDNVTPAASTTSGSPTVTITDAVTEDISSYDSVVILTHISVGGLILFGTYPCANLTATTYEITATNALGTPLPATSTSTTATVASFTTTASSNVVNVTLANHGFTVGSTYPVMVSTSVGGITLFGDYTVLAVGGANQFTIEAQQLASSAATASINGGDAGYIYSFGLGALPGASGYGSGGYGSGGYGTGSAVTPSVGTPISASEWTLDNFGNVLLACPVNSQGSIFQPIYQYDPTGGSPTATIIPTAPTVNDSIFVAMPQRQVIALGSTLTGIQDPLLIRWSDVSNFNTWIGTVTNQAGYFRIPRGSRIVGGMQGPQQALIWTDLGVWSMMYQGGELVYGFDEVSQGCGLVGRRAMASLGETVYWMSQSQFFTITEGGVQILPCDVWDVVFQTIDLSHAQNIRCAANSRFNEVAWFFPTLTSNGEVAAYVKYNALMQAWDYGTLARSAWIDQSVLGAPIGTDPSNCLIYQHETSNDADGQALLASFTTGFFAVSDGDFKTFVDRVWPDFKWGQYSAPQNATVQITFLVVDYPGDPVQTFGPFSVTQAVEFFNPRLRGRLVALQINSSDIGSFWRIGGLRYRGKPDGKQ